jgi:peroxiredoxin family protein
MFELVIIVMLQGDVQVASFKLEACPLVSEIEGLKEEFKINEIVYVSCNYQNKKVSF